MVELLATKLINKDTASQQGNIDKTSLQQTIAKQLEVPMPSIIKATVNYMLQNKLLDKNINTTVGTMVSTMTGDIVQHVKKIRRKPLELGLMKNPRHQTQKMMPPLAVLVLHLHTKDVSLHKHVLEMKISQTTNNLKNRYLRILMRSIKNNSSHKHCGASHFSSEKC
jgi:hypothetical protein